MEIFVLITEFEKHIYNTFLRVSRSRNKQPFKLRKNFEKVDNELYVSLKKVSSFLKRFPQIKIDDYFNAPYNVYPDETYFPLEYFHTLKATKAYTLFNKQKENLDPDSLEQLNSIKTSLVFISNFCRDKNILPEKYILHKTNNEYSFVLHLKEHNVNIYTLLGFVDFERIFKSRDAEVLKFILGEETFNNISAFKTKLFNSKKAVKLVDLGIKKILLKNNA